MTLVSGNMSRQKICKGSPQRNVPNEGGVGFFCEFREICRHVWKTVHFRQSYYGTVIGNHMPAIEWCHFRWPWVTPDPGFKGTVVLKGEYLQSDAFYRHSYYIRTLIGNRRHTIDRQASYTALTPLLLRQPCKLFASVARVWQRQPAFLVVYKSKSHGLHSWWRSHIDRCSCPYGETISIGLPSPNSLAATYDPHNVSVRLVSLPHIQYLHKVQKFLK